MKGVAIAREPKIIPNEMFEEVFVEAPVVISTLPVWTVLRVVPEAACPTGTSPRSATSPRDEFRGRGSTCTSPPRSR